MDRKTVKKKLPAISQKKKKENKTCPSQKHVRLIFINYSCTNIVTHLKLETCKVLKAKIMLRSKMWGAGCHNDFSGQLGVINVMEMNL